MQHVVHKLHTRMHWHHVHNAYSASTSLPGESTPRHLVACVIQFSPAWRKMEAALDIWYVLQEIH